MTSNKLLALITAVPSTAVTPFRYQRHPIADVIPEMNAGELAALKASIGKFGLDYPIVLYEGKILKGWARYLACSASDTQPNFRQFDPDREGDPQEFVWRQFFQRKHLDKQQRAMIAARLVTSKVGHNQNSPSTTIVGAAKIANVTAKMVERALAIHRTSSIVADAVANGRIPSIRVAQKLMKLPKAVQLSVLRSDSTGAVLKKAIHAADRETKLAQPIVTPAGRFSVIVADPPWPMDKSPYPTMTLGEVENDLRRLLDEKGATDCHLFLWTTMANLPCALPMVERLGWTYKFLMTWRKANGPKNPNGPMYTEEFVIVATMGSPCFPDTRRFKTGFEGKSQRHSEKPQEFFDLIKRVTAEPRLELYARKPHDGFEPHGNAVEQLSMATPSLAPATPEETINKAEVEDEMRATQFLPHTEPALSRREGGEGHM